MKILSADAVGLALMCLCWPEMSQGQLLGSLDDLTTRFTCKTKATGRFCGGIDYAHFAIPNFQNATEEREIDAELDTYITLYSTGCSNALLHLLCAYYKPLCFNILPSSEPIRLPPCRELCLYVRSSCEPAQMDVIHETATWPDHLDCDQFPLKSDKSGMDCFPNFHKLEDYQTQLQLPPIPGTSLPSTVQTANNFWGSPPAESTLPMIMDSGMFLMWLHVY